MIPVRFLRNLGNGLYEIGKLARKTRLREHPEADRQKALESLRVVSALIAGVNIR